MNTDDKRTAIRKAMGRTASFSGTFESIGDALAKEDRRLAEEFRDAVKTRLLAKLPKSFDAAEYPMTELDWSDQHESILVEWEGVGQFEIDLPLDRFYHINPGGKYDIGVSNGPKKWHVSKPSPNWTPDELADNIIRQLENMA